VERCSCNGGGPKWEGGKLPKDNKPS